MRATIVKGLAVLAAGAACAIAGYQYAAALYGQDIAALREDYAVRARALEVKYREKERAQYQSLLDAWQARDEALSRVDALSVDIDRVRSEAAAAKRRLSATAADTRKPEREQLARCAGLLERGCGLLNRGVEISAKFAIDKDTVTKIITQ